MQRWNQNGIFIDIKILFWCPIFHLASRGLRAVSNNSARLGLKIVKLVARERFTKGIGLQDKGFPLHFDGDKPYPWRIYFLLGNQVGARISQ
jgi:hypothetical protein